MPNTVLPCIKQDIVYALHGENYDTGVSLDRLVDVGEWISTSLGRQNASRVGPALLAKRKTKEQKAKL